MKLRRLKLNLTKYDEDFSWRPYFWTDDPEAFCFGWLWLEGEWSRSSSQETKTE